MKAIGVDPGRTIGLCLYDLDARRVIDACECRFAEDAVDVVHAWRRDNDYPRVAIEWPRAYGLAGNDIADACAQAGALYWACGGRLLPAEPEDPRIGDTCVVALTRQQVTKRLSQELAEQVKGDAGVWSALLTIHGGKGVADKRSTKASPEAGPLSLLAGKPHAKAALAVAWAAFG